MKCFYHHETDAVAICKNCNRGLCIDCAAEVENGIACKNRCEIQARALSVLAQHTSGAVLSNALLVAAFGLVFGCLGLGMITVSPVAWLFIVTGIGILVYSAYSFSTRRQLLHKLRIDVDETREKKGF